MVYAITYENPKFELGPLLYEKYINLATLYMAIPSLNIYRIAMCEKYLSYKLGGTRPGALSEC